MPARTSDPEGLRGLLRRWSASDAEADSQELSDAATARGASVIGDLRPGAHAEVSGRVRSIVLRPRSGLHALEIDISDGTGRMLLVFLGRRRIGGIEPGRSLTAHGRVTTLSGIPAMYNPRYELHPSVGSA